LGLSILKISLLNLKKGIYFLCGLILNKEDTIMGCGCGGKGNKPKK
jgi:hypothetical protein